MTDPFLSRIPAGLAGRVLDSSALIDLSLGRTVYAQTFARRAAALGLTWAVPTTAVAEAWARLSDKGRLGLSVLVQLGHTVVEPLDVHRAGPVGEALEEAGPGFDVCAAHVVEVAARRGWPVLTDRGVLLRTVVPGLEIEPLP